VDEPAAVEVMREFHGQLLHFDRFAELSKVGVADYDESINPELEEASYLFFDRVFSEGYGLEEIFVSTSGFVGPNMAELYALPTSGAGLEERDLGPGRAGFFTQLPFLMLYAHNDGPDAIHRGVSMSLDVLCAPLGPPAAVIPPLPVAKPGQTNRQRVDEHTSGCGGACHNQMINPLGFAFENFDGMGRFREVEHHGFAPRRDDQPGERWGRAEQQHCQRGHGNEDGANRPQARGSGRPRPAQDTVGVAGRPARHRPNAIRTPARAL